MKIYKYTLISASLLFTSLSAHALTCKQLYRAKIGIGHARVAISGSHTDYNGGWTLASLLPVKTTAVAVKTPGDLIEVSSIGETVSYRLGSEKEQANHWSDYIRGITAVLQQQGYSIGGTKIEIDSTIPHGAGISSSAALATSIIKALRQIYPLKKDGKLIDDMEIARLGQKVEQFVGANTGLLDQMTISILDRDVNSALFIDFSTGAYKKVQMPADAEFVIVHSGLTHSLKDTHGTRNYATRRKQCEGVCERLNIPSLSSITLKELEARKDEIKDPGPDPELSFRRARHVITENERVQRMMKSASDGDLVGMGQVMNESHLSQMRDYEISEGPIDGLAGLLRRQPGVYGAQLTGGGFGGAVVFLAKKGEGVRIARSIMQQYLNLPENGGQYEAKIIAPVTEAEAK